MSDFLSELVDRHTDRLPRYTKYFLLGLVVLIAIWCIRMLPVERNYTLNTPTVKEQVHYFANTTQRNS